MQKWKTDPSLYNCERDEHNKKKLDYSFYTDEFLGQDEIRDWESISRCIELWEFSKKIINWKGNEKVIDCGTKDGQFTDFLCKEGFNAIGIEIDEKYVDYAKSKERNVKQGDICNLKEKAGTFHISFAHHVLGLCPDYKKAYQEMLRVTKKNGYIITLNSVPGNKRKHYSYIETSDEIKEILSDCPKHKVIYFDYWRKGTGTMEDELVVILKKV